MLMVSGIGPRQTLEQHDIPVISDLPGVGQNLWACLPNVPALQPPLIPATGPAFLRLKLSSQLDYAITTSGRGLLVASHRRFPCKSEWTTDEQRSANHW